MGKRQDTHNISSHIIYRPSEGWVYSECIVQQRQLHKSRGLSLLVNVIVFIYMCHAVWRAHRTGCILFHHCVSGKVPIACGREEKVRRSENKKKKEHLPRSATNPLSRPSASLAGTISVIFISIASLSDLSLSSYFLLPHIPSLLQGAC